MARRLRLQLVIERSVIAVILLAAAAAWGYHYLTFSSCAIFADGKRIAVVENKAEAEALLQESLAIGARGIARNPEFAQKIELRRWPTRSGLDRESALAVLKAKLTVQADKWTILIDNRPYAALDTEQQAGEVLEMARQRYGKLAPNLLEEPSFKENVTAQLRKVDLNLWLGTPQEAVEALFTPTGGKPLTHLVQKGDLASTIAEKYGISLADMAKLNPGGSLDRLQIGDQLKIGSGTAPLTVVVRDLITRTETMPYTTESVSSVKMRAGKVAVLSPGRPGKRIVKLAVTYENGLQTGQEILEESILRPPSPRRVAVGIRAGQ